MKCHDSKGIRRAVECEFCFGKVQRVAYDLFMASVATLDLTQQIAAEAALLPIDKQSSVLDFVLFVKHQSQQQDDGDAKWESIIADPRPRPRLEAYLKSIENSPVEPLEFSNP
jgi:hypothetical protein